MRQMRGGSVVLDDKVLGLGLRWAGSLLRNDNLRVHQIMVRSVAIFDKISTHRLRSYQLLRVLQWASWLLLTHFATSRSGDTFWWFDALFPLGLIPGTPRNSFVSRVLFSGFGGIFALSSPYLLHFFSLLVCARIVFILSRLLVLSVLFIFDTHQVIISTTLITLFAPLNTLLAKDFKTRSNIVTFTTRSPNFTTIFAFSWPSSRLKQTFTKRTRLFERTCKRSPLSLAINYLAILPKLGCVVLSRRVFIFENSCFREDFCEADIQCSWISERYIFLRWSFTRARPRWHSILAFKSSWTDAHTLFIASVVGIFDKGNILQTLLFCFKQDSTLLIHLRLKVVKHILKFRNLVFFGIKENFQVISAFFKRISRSFCLILNPLWLG